MTTPEVALTYLVVVWTLLFLGLGAAVLILVRKVQTGLDLINDILLTTKNMATSVAEPINIVANAVHQFVGDRKARKEQAAQKARGTREGDCVPAGNGPIPPDTGAGTRHG
ncbi:MAG: hypothetical protein FD129_1590 [bacterium]|nr:MAG: hypothetical protein FD129_1590 [bacterium]